MDTLLVGKLWEFYVDTLNKCGTYLLNDSDEVIEYNIFEEFDIGVISFLHDDSLGKLYKNKLISKIEEDEARTLRYLVLGIQDKNEWNVKSLRTSADWKKILELCDKINKHRI